MTAALIVALDLPGADEARRLADRLPGLEWVKIGPTLFLRGGDTLVGEFKDRGLRVFLDLKWHDIPHQVAGAVAAAVEMGVDLATVHLSGGPAMLEAAVEAADGRMRLAGVSVLTSHTAASYGEGVGRTGVEVGEEVERLVRLGLAAGVGAVVCSPEEVPRVTRVVGADVWRVVPGVRPAGTATDDQSRTATPEAAVAAGATHLVVGRPIWRSETPDAVYRTLTETLNSLPGAG